MTEIPGSTDHAWGRERESSREMRTGGGTLPGTVQCRYVRLLRFHPNPAVNKPWVNCQDRSGSPCGLFTRGSCCATSRTCSELIRVGEKAHVCMPEDCANVLSLQPLEATHTAPQSARRLALVDPWTAHVAVGDIEVGTGRCLADRLRLLQQALLVISTVGLIIIITIIIATVAASSVATLSGEEPRERCDSGIYPVESHVGDGVILPHPFRFGRCIPSVQPERGCDRKSNGRCRPQVPVEADERLGLHVPVPQHVDLIIRHLPRMLIMTGTLRWTTRPNRI